ncbi:hypothetical protein E8E12_002208 [Didymella heteroderae]|uniref:Heterokaryon incompatibility domain-containing protein n=1 Tax=Didymella heteroderae TaxID=1769908 RepID=A0A9P5C1Q3_9PLEO|nr:hypothetical protein E8E12_002208 [Didymella heteroderae]
MDSPHADDAAWSSRLVTPADPLHASVVLQHVFPRHIDLEQVKSWLLECETTHGQGCASTRQAPVLKLKVIDVERMQVVTAPDDCVFAALSYVWGNGSDYPIDPNRLESSPQTIRQSILLVQSLGYRYLWIDRYCIDQGNAAEKHHQIMRMGDIYSAAHFTIVAAAGSNPDYGLPGVLPDNRKGPRFQIKDSVCFYEVPQTSALEDVAMSTWASRGWTYQESFLSRRRLVFTDRQVIYICNNTTHFEATTKPYLGIPDDAYPYDDAFIEFWLPQRHGKDGNLKTLHPILRAQNYLSGYSVRTLRYETDALNAIAGALNTLAKENVYHLWGVPVHVPELKPCSSSDSSSSGSKDWLDSEGLHTIAVQDLSLKSERDEPAPVRNTASDTLVQGLNYVLEPHAIELEAHTVHLTLFRDTEKLRPLKVDKGPGVRFSLNDKYTIAFWVHWDLPQTEVEGFSSLTGVFLPARGRMKRGKEACIVLRKVQDHYERVGISKAGVFPTEAPHGWDNQAESQVFDSTLWCLNNMEIKELSHGFNDSSGIEWWQRVVRTETIVIV